MAGIGRVPRAVAVALSGALCGLPPADAGEGGKDKDHDRAHRALSAGEIAPLSEVLGAVRDRVAGDVVDIELEREDGVWVYEVKLIDGRGRLLELYVDARTKRIRKIEGQ